MARAKILVVDDNPHILAMLKDGLGDRGFQVLTADGGKDALQTFRDARPDLLVLDISMPDLDGLQVCRIIRQESAVPILFLTARSQLEDKLEGFDLGATDYITKPFEVLELVARIKAALRHREAGDRLLTFGHLQVDIAGNQAYREGERLKLSRTEFELLKVLSLHAGRTVTRQFLLETVWGYEESVVSRTLDSFIRNLREKVEIDPRRPALIKTMHGIGYRLDGDAANG